MKFTIQWLKEHLDTKLSDEKIIEKLTFIGLEVESFERVCDTLTNRILMFNGRLEETSMGVGSVGRERRIRFTQAWKYAFFLQPFSKGALLFEYPNKIPFSYSGTRAGHGNPYGFASRWSGQWIIHGEKGDLKRDGGRITVYKNGNVTEDVYLKDLDNNLIEDEKRQFDAVYLSLISK